MLPKCSSLKVNNSYHLCKCIPLLYLQHENYIGPQEWSCLQTFFQSMRRQAFKWEPILHKKLKDTIFLVTDFLGILHFMPIVFHFFFLSFGGYYPISMTVWHKFIPASAWLFSFGVVGVSGSSLAVSSTGSETYKKLLSKTVLSVFWCILQFESIYCFLVITLVSFFFKLSN